MSTRRLISILVFCLYIAAVAYLCFAKAEDLPKLSTTIFGIPADKAAHIIMFLPFPLLAYLVVEPARTKWYWKGLITFGIAVTGVGLAFLTEEIQAELTYRTKDVKDFLCDMYGLSAGIFITIIYMLFRR